MGRELSEREGILLNKDEEVSGEVVYGFEHCGWYLCCSGILGKRTK